MAGYPGHLTPSHCFYVHHLTRASAHRPSRTTYTPQSWYLGQFGFTGYYITQGPSGRELPKDILVGVYLSNGHGELHRPIRCRVSLLAFKPGQKERIVLIDLTLGSVEEWTRGAVGSVKLAELPKWAWGEIGSLVFRFDTEWC